MISFDSPFVRSIPGKPAEDGKLAQMLKDALAKLIDAMCVPRFTFGRFGENSLQN